MQEALRLLAGEQWADVLLQRKQAQGLAILACVAFAEVVMASLGIRK
jgi:hypothetical protein